METRALRYFQAVAEYGSLSRGAAVLRVSQPAVSRQIRALEATLARPLFIRHGHGVNLTAAGRVLLVRSQAILRAIEQTEAEIHGGRVGPSGTITFALPPAAGHFLMPALTERLAALYPDVFLKVVGGYSFYIHEWLMRGQVDLACVHDPLAERSFATVPLVREQAYVVGRAGNFPFRRPYVRIQDFARLPMILTSRPNASRRILDARLAALGLPLNLAMEVDDPSIIRALLSAGKGFSILSQGAIESELRYHELEARALHPPIHWQLALVRPARAAEPEIVGTFAAVVIEVARRLAQSGAWPGQWVGPPRIAAREAS